MDPMSWVWRRSKDPLKLAESAQDALDRFQEQRPCAWLGCTGHAVPEHEPYLMGHDHDGGEVWFRRWLCDAGHRYDLEHVPRTTR